MMYDAGVKGGEADRLRCPSGCLPHRVVTRRAATCRLPPDINLPEILNFEGNWGKLMEYRLLGRSGLKVSTITFGTMNFGREDPSKPLFSMGVEAARRHLDLAIDRGLNLIDTSDGYAKGASEEIIGEALAGKRQKVLIATKCFNPMGPGPNDTGLSRYHIIASCEASLKRLRTDYVDLYQAHKWDGQTPVEEFMEAYDRLIRDGKVRYIGCSNFSGWHLMKSLGVSEKYGRERFVSQQVCYTLISREAEHELVPIAVDQGIGMLIWGPLAGGLLSGKFRRGKEGPAGTRHAGFKWHSPPVHDWERVFDIIEELIAVAEARGVSAAQVALAWLLSRPGVTSTIVGARTEEQLADNLGAADLKLSEEEEKRLEKASRLPLPYPYWHQLFMCKERFGPADLALHAPYMEAN
jgi:aryl-alcohol dehydrogenase-like predicted oxidoreductase